MGIYIQYIIHSLLLIFDPKCGGLCGGGGVSIVFIEKQCFLISCFLHVLRTNKLIFPVGGGGWGACVKKMVVLASEPVGGRSRTTELPCFQCAKLDLYSKNVKCYIYIKNS